MSGVNVTTQALFTPGPQAASSGFLALPLSAFLSSAPAYPRGLSGYFTLLPVPGNPSLPDHQPSNPGKETHLPSGSGGNPGA